MRRIPGLRRVFRFPRRSRQQIDRDIDEELAFHVDMVAAELIAAGVPEREARERSRRQFGDLEWARRNLRREEQGIERERRRADLGNELRQDLTFGLRQLRQSPGFAFVAVVTLGLGIGATTAIFSVVDGVLLRPLPYAQADRLVRLRQVDGRKSDGGDTSPATYLDWRDRSRSFQHVAFFQYFGHDVKGSSGETTSINSWLVSEEYFAALGVKPRLGRVFLPEEYRPGAARVVVISSTLWQQRYGGDPRVLGRQELLDGVAHTIVGVMPLSFQYPEKRHIWAPKILSEEDTRVRAGTYLDVVARLRPGVTLTAAQDDMNRISRELAAEYPRTNAKVGVLVTSVPNDVVGPVRPALLVLLGAVICRARGGPPPRVRDPRCTRRRTWTPRATDVERERHPRDARLRGRPGAREARDQAHPGTQPGNASTNGRDRARRARAAVHARRISGHGIDLRARPGTHVLEP
jgi:hypothetical protein